MNESKRAIASPIGVNRLPQNDSNHRYAIGQAIHNQMLGLGWLGEGVVFCVPV